jgi:hypothetical protein
MTRNAAAATNSTDTNWTEEDFRTEWSGFPDPTDPDNFWIDDVTGERVNASSGERSSPADFWQPA